MSSGRCASCSKPALSGKSHCLEHHKEQTNQAGAVSYAYGLDHDIQQKLASKFDSGKADAVRVWIESVTKRSLNRDLHEALKSGVVLCELINGIWPGSVPKINQGSMPFVQRENIVAYLSACKSKGMRETDCFVTGDLYEAQNMVQVVDQLCALGQLASTKGFRGPQLLISGGAVQVASPHAVVKSQPPAQVDIFAKPGNAQPAVLSSPPAAKPSPPAAAAGGAGFAKFCGNCGQARADANVKFCGGCGTKF